MEVFITKYVLLLRSRLLMLYDWLIPLYICMELLNCSFFLFVTKKISITFMGETHKLCFQF